nr:hypothetical protein [Pleurocapsa sp. PCC 7319]
MKPSKIALIAQDILDKQLPVITMTELLNQAVARIKNLPDNEQDAIATIILEELEDEIKWEQAFSNSQDLLAELAAEAMTEYRAGKTQELDPEKL